MAMVAIICPGGTQPYYHLIPPQIFAQGSGKSCRGAFGQLIQLPYHLLSLVHGVKTVHPKHDLNLDFQRQHAAKRFVPRIDQPSAVHVGSTQHEMGPLRSDPPLFMGSLNQSPTRARTWGPTQKSVPMGGTP